MSFKIVQESAGLSANTFSKLRSAGWSAGSIVAPESAEQVFYVTRISQMLGENVSRVFGALYLAEFNGIGPDLLLQPKILSIYMAQFAKAAAATDAHARGGICPHPERQGDTEVL